MPRDVSADAQFPPIVGQYVSKPKEDRIMQYYGFRGDNKVFVGQSTDRMMVWASGNEAHYIAKTLNTSVFESFSVARMDLQITITSLDADYMIEYIQPAKIYKATKVTNINEKGTTLYVGAPTSNIRLRVYNKTAEAGIVPDSGGEYVRFELQCRNQYADKAFTAFRNNMVRSFYLMIIKRMIDAYNYKLVEGAIRSSEEELFIDDFPSNKDDPVARKKRWLEQSVLPALRRLLVEDREYVDNFVKLLYDGAVDGSNSDTY
jgi:Replication initiation factor.